MRCIIIDENICEPRVHNVLLMKLYDVALTYGVADYRADYCGRSNGVCCSHLKLILLTGHKIFHCDGGELSCRVVHVSTRRDSQFPTG